MRKKVLILGHNAATQFIDVYNQYTRVFDPAIYDVTVAYLSGKDDAAARTRTIAEHVLFLDNSTSSLRGLKFSAIKQLYRLCNENHYEIVICHRYKPTYIMLIVSKLLTIPNMIFVMHELGTMNHLGRRLLTGILTSTNMIYAGVSNAVRDDMQKDMWFVNPKQIVTLYNMIDIELTEPTLLSKSDARAALGLPQDAFLFGNLARLSPNKDQKTLIDAFTKFKKEAPDAKLIILGDGELETALKSHVNKTGLENDVVFKGFVPQANRYMKAFDCFVLSSIQEAFGRVLIEAMIARVPIIATRVNGIPEVVSDVGTLVPPSDPDQFSSAMLAIYNSTSSERDAIANKAYAYVNRTFSIPTFTNDFWSLPIFTNHTTANKG